MVDELRCNYEGAWMGGRGMGGGRGLDGGLRYQIRGVG